MEDLTKEDIEELSERFKSVSSEHSGLINEEEVFYYYFFLLPFIYLFISIFNFLFLILIISLFQL